ncbi:RNA polymerase sigma factor [Zunongwangia atlantica]|uniref:RNA polymerase ECF-type sigma factor n=1 Tax=Zunongwangia atlantica 22II14-10F7 TaxID=1185767 RepID=A0A1Y1T6Z5_9FLAO|nr:RNA polymerase sigma-70 factor [Zunongwangia atlantica]ORL46820.1 RNA polymerase ECF-type sigma factor [Zunongwangia atlantica 22II14-10F7]
MGIRFDFNFFVAVICLQLEAKKLNESSDTILIALVSKGNQLAFEQVYHNYWDKLYVYTNNILNDTWLTEDVLHEVFTQIWIRREELEIRNLKSYLYNSVRNRALLKLRDNKFTKLDELIVNRLNLSPEIEQEFDKNDTIMAIEKATSELPERCRAIFYMSKFQHYSSAEIANHFNISQRTVENQVSLALKHLRSELGASLFISLFFGGF